MKSKKIVLKHYLGAQPEAMVTDFWTASDWEDFRKYQDKLKTDNEFGKEVESTLILNHSDVFESNELIFDLNNIKKHVLNPLKKTD